MSFDKSNISFMQRKIKSTIEVTDDNWISAETKPEIHSPIITKDSDGYISLNVYWDGVYWFEFVEGTDSIDAWPTDREIVCWKYNTV